MDKKPPLEELEQVVNGLKEESFKVKRAEARLSLEKKQPESLIEHSALAMVTVNEQHNIISCNQGFEKLFQFEAYDILEGTQKQFTLFLDNGPGYYRLETN